MTCQRCGSNLDEQGYCTDVTCPFNDHLQSCSLGWEGHPDKNQREMWRSLNCTSAEENAPDCVAADERPLNNFIADLMAVMRKHKMYISGSIYSMDNPLYAMPLADGKEGDTLLRDFERAMYKNTRGIV